MPRELILLSPYTPPTHHALMLGVEETNCWLHAWSALWHPLAVIDSIAPPKWASPYDYETPSAGQLFAIPEPPALYLASDWDDRVRQAGAAVFRATQERDSTLHSLRDALAQIDSTASPRSWSDEELRPFFGLGLAYATIESLFDAMEHEHLLDREAFWADVKEAAHDPKSALPFLQQAAAKLQAARDSLYPVTIHLIDFAILDSKHAEKPLPAALARQSPLNIIATGATLEALGREHPERLRELVIALKADGDEPKLEICGGPYLDREDELLPVESQLWNLHRGLAAIKEALDFDVQTFASARGTFQPQTPVLLQHVGLTRALLLSFDDARLPSHKAAVVQWSSGDGRQIESFTRTPLPADDPQSYFNLAHHLHQTIMQDSAATVALVHRPDAPAAPWYEDWLAVSALAPVLGTWTTVSRYFGSGVVGEYATPATADDFAIDALEPRCGGAFPVSAFARHLRLRRRLDAARTYDALDSAFGGGRDTELHDSLQQLEGRIERFEQVQASEIEQLEHRAAMPLVDRLLSGAGERQPGLLLLNPCAFARRVVLERDDLSGAIPSGGIVKAAQRDGNTTRLVVEVPALGFAWLPCSATADNPQSEIRNPKSPRLADQRGVRNEFFDAEIDPTTGGLRSIRDARSRENRLGQQLVFQPGSKIVVKDIQVVSTGPAVGEIVSTGALMDEHDAVLATFRQRFRAWLGRPLLDMRIELYVAHKPQGYPWHAYYGARFAWRDERATLLRGVVGQGGITTHTRPTTPDYLELRSGQHRTLILPGGLPFHQRHGSRMLDVILVPQGESATTFELALGLDREQPMQTAFGLTSPLLAVPVEKGPPHVGPNGWLFHLDAPNLLMTSMVAERGEARAITARMLELSGYAGGAELRCPRDPKDAALIDALGAPLQALYPQGDAVAFEYGANDLVSVRITF